MRYIIKTNQEHPNANSNYIVRLTCHVNAKNAQEAIRKGHITFTEMGYSGPFRGTSAENIDDGHDYWRDTV